MLSIHSRRKVPWIFLIEGVTDDDFPGTVCSTLLEVVTTGDPLVIMALTASSLRTVRIFAVNREGIPIESPQNNCFVDKDLGEDQGRVKQRKEQDDREIPKKFFKFSRHIYLFLEPKAFFMTYRYLNPPVAKNSLWKPGGGTGKTLQRHLLQLAIGLSK